MRQKIRKGKLEACKLVWKKRITAEKGISDKCAERIVQECIKLVWECSDSFLQAGWHVLSGKRNTGRI